jgi:hypothetical protein
MNTGSPSRPSVKHCGISSITAAAPVAAP